MIPVVDIFAGPGGLGEGFSSFVDPKGRSQFSLALSVEKDPVAHQTLRLRSLYRQLDGELPTTWPRHRDDGFPWRKLELDYPKLAERAAAEARQIELGPDEDIVRETRRLIKDALRGTDEWVLVGGPPCQAYSLIGRARNSGKAGYRPEKDIRQTLYLEYLQILADHAPPVFVMENVKGLLSAQLQSRYLFERITTDLTNPAKALREQGRSAGGRRPTYQLRTLVRSEELFDEDPKGYVIRAERFGIPQRRHRVIILGVRSDLSSAPRNELVEVDRRCTVAEALRGLPRLRSGISRHADSDSGWLEAIENVRGRRWLSQIDAAVRDRVCKITRDIKVPKDKRGAEVLLTSSGEVTLNHSARSHIVPDLERYLFASAFAAETGSSPKLSDFPRGLLPKHKNVDRGINEGVFSDRFRVQVANEPSTTVTSHISKDGHYYIHPDSFQCRSLTVREAARLQTFPDDYFFCGGRTAQYHQVGNAVPPALARQIAQVVWCLLQS